MTRSDRKICIGAFAGAHGVRGEAKVKAFTEIGADVCAYGPVTTDQGTTYRLVFVREAKPGLVIIRSAQIASREEAEALKGQKLYVSRSALPPPDEEEFYHEDLVGLAAETVEGTPYGKVKAVVNYGAGDILELAQVPGEKGSVLIAFTKESVPEIDFAAGRVVVVPDRGEAGDDAAGS